jgi:hypothetical protein
MADLFDALAARALGIAPVLSPALPPRFAEPAEEPGQGEPVGTGTSTAGGIDSSPQAGGAPPTATEGRVQPEQSRPETPAPSADPAAHPRRLPAPAPTAPPVKTEKSPWVERIVAVEAVDREAEPARGFGRLSRTEETAAPAPALWPEQEPAPATRASARVPDQGPSSELPRPATERAVVERLRALPAQTDSGANRPPTSQEEPSGGGPEAATRVTVTIGRVDVHAPARAAPPPTSQRPRWPEPRLSLQDYLRQASRR